MEHTQHRAGGLKCLVKWPLLCGLLCLALARLAAAQTVPLYQNIFVQNYVIPGAPPPTIDATSFYNSANAFNVNFTALTINQELYETWNTLNYTNVGTMVSDSGFQFDLQTTNLAAPNQMAANFYNSHRIDCASITDTNVYFLLGVGQCIIWATNIVNPGTINVGGNGLMRFTGQNINLSHGVLTMEGNDQSSIFAPVVENIYGIPGLVGLDYGVGTDTTNAWYPSVDLTPNFAISSEFSTAIFYPPPLIDEMVLPNSTAYFDVRTNVNATNDIVVRGVFLLNTVPGVSNNVYIDVNTGGSNLLGVGAAHVEWTAPYIDPSSGLLATNYLYVTDDYLDGNNPFVYDNIPDNYTFDVTTAPVIFGPPTPAGFPTNLVFNPAVVTNNNYSYASVQFSASTVTTNSPSPNVTNYLGILPGRIEINATNELNLTAADIVGPNYISIYAPHQFDGSGSAQIYAPYADLNIGVTNGYLTVSNLLQSGIGRWNGTLQLWSTTWIYVDGNGVTNDYRILFVNSQLSPTTPSFVNNLILHAPNSDVINDGFNILGTFSTDAQNLTLATNGPGATVTAGELNIETAAILWSASTPNLRNLTNNGIINLQNISVFGTAPTNEYYSLINHGTISDQGSFIWADNFASSGVFFNGANQFVLQSKTTTLTNGLLVAGGDVSITTSNLFATNVVILSGQELAIVATNLTDGVTNGGASSGNFWSVGGEIGVGLNVPSKPSGDLLGTTITNFAPDNVIVAGTWPGEDRGASVAGYTNNLAMGRLVLDYLPPVANPHPNTTKFTFNGPGVSNAIYVDELILADSATNLDGSHNVKAFDNADGNVTIYYARALAGGNDVSEKLDGRNNKHLRWVPAYVGYFSSTNLVYTNIVGGVTNLSTNTVNAALAQSPDLDSDGDGIPNVSDPTPFFVSGEVNFKLTTTNLPPLTVLLSWQSIPAATNYVLYTTNLVSPNWQGLTNFNSPAAVPPAGGWPLTNSASDVVNPAAPRYYRIEVIPNNADLYGPY